MRNYVIGTSDHAGRHLNMVQAENVQAALEMCGVLDLGLYLSVQTLTGERLADTTCLRTDRDKYVHWTQVSRKDLEEATAYVKSILRIT